MIREFVRSGRRANFYTTENSFIDLYAKDVGALGVAVYHVLERHANCETRSTWIGTAKMATLLGYSQRQIQRILKRLEDLKLIRVLRTENMTTYVIVPVPPRAKNVTTPLFDDIPDHESDEDLSATLVTSASQRATAVSRETTLLSRLATPMPQASDTGVTAYKEEQDFLNKTFEQEDPATQEAANRIVTILGLPSSFAGTAGIVVNAEVDETGISHEAAVTRIVTEANLAKRRGIAGHDRFLEGLAASVSAKKIAVELGLPETTAFISTIAAALKAEVKYAGLDLEQVTAQIKHSAAEDRRRGIQIDKFYFEDVKWRSNGRVSKAEQRKLNNLEVNARVKQRLREKFGTA